MWKDKCPVLLISTHALPIGFPCVPVDKVPRRNGTIREMVLTSPMLLEYTTFMRGVDVLIKYKRHIPVRAAATNGGTAFSGPCLTLRR
jgi:hypothetical protein